MIFYNFSFVAIPSCAGVGAVLRLVAKNGAVFSWGCGCAPLRMTVAKRIWDVVDDCVVLILEYKQK